MVQEIVDPPFDVVAIGTANACAGSGRIGPSRLRSTHTTHTRGGTSAYKGEIRAAVRAAQQARCFSANQLWEVRDTIRNAPVRAEVTEPTSTRSSASPCGDCHARRNAGRGGGKTWAALP